MTTLHTRILWGVFLISAQLLNDGRALAQETSKPAPHATQQQPSDLPIAARLLSAEGEVQIKPQDGGSWQLATSGQLLAPGAVITVGNSSQATLILNDGQIIELQEGVTRLVAARRVQPVAYIHGVMDEVTLRRANGITTRPRVNDPVFWNDILEISQPARVIVTFRIGKGVNVELNETTIFDRVTLSSVLKPKLTDVEYSQLINSSLLDDTNLTGSLDGSIYTEQGSTRRTRYLDVTTPFVNAAVEG